MRLDVDFEEVLPHPIDAVWHQLVHAEAISDWLMATLDFRPTVGSRFRLKTEHLSTSGWVEAEVLEASPPHRMVWSWSAADGNPPSLVTFELTAVGGATRVRLRHVGEFEPGVVEILSSGWPGRIQAIGTAIKGGGDG